MPGMPPSVKIEAKAWDDPRFVLVARRLGLHSLTPRHEGDTALILTARVWAHLTESNATTLPARTVDAITGVDGFADALVAERLAEEVGPGELRLCGTSDPGRTDWLQPLRERNRSGGRSRARSARRGPDGKMLAGNRLDDNQLKLPAEPSQSPEDSSALTLTLKEYRSRSPSRSEEAGEEDPETTPDSQPVPSRYPAGQVLAEHLRNLLLSQQPGHQVRKASRWNRSAPVRARQLDELAGERGGPGPVRAMLDWLFSAAGVESGFVVQSPTSLAEKWDRVELCMRRRAPARRARGPEFEDWGSTSAAERKE